VNDNITNSDFFGLAAHHLASGVRENVAYKDAITEDTIQILAQKAALEAQIEAGRKAENAGAIAKVKALISEHGLTQQDIFGGAKRGRKASGSVVAMYKAPISGATWSCRGIAPKWLKGKDRNQFAI
jgi:DNA-binding protein H-NS